MKRTIKNAVHKIKAKISDYKIKKQFNKDVKLGYILEDGEPIKCYKCGSFHMSDYNYDCIEHTTCEFSRKCVDCGQKLGNWAYGNWQM